MMSPDVETHIKKNSSWSTLPQTVKQALGNIEGNWEQCVSDYCIKNQLRFKGSLVRQVRKDEKKYYKELIQHSRQHLMLYPYHLSDIVVKGLRLTPFGYYCNMMEDIMLLEKSYDSLPNFTAADCLRLLGIGRNQYIDMMNQCKSSKRFFRAKRPPRELLPVKPIAQTVIPTWWVANTGYITDDDVKLCSTEEIDLIDRLIDKGATPVHKLPQDTVRTLYNRGLIYMDVAIDGEDYIVVPPLENFVMNRVLGDYMETLLYKVFVSVDQHTTVAELAQVLELDLSLTKNAISLFCRLGLAVKKEGEERHNSTEQTSLSNSRKFDGSSADLLVDFDDELPTLQSDSGSEKDLLLPDTMSDDIPTSPDCGIQQAKRIAFLFDSTLTAFLMMGNLSQGLKRHAVTMFEVGKLPDESLDNFVAELEKIENVTNEGEAQRYFDHAIVLKNTIQYLRKNPHLTTDESHSKLDLVRIESIANLDPSICGRILQKKYNMLVSMAPLSNEIRPITSCSPPHIGPAIPEVNSVWFKLFVYTAIKQGPPSLLLVKGTRLKKLPSFLRGYDKLLITTWSHDPAVVSTSNVLFSLNEALAHSPLLLQGHGIYGEGDTLNIAFPFDDTKDLDTSIAKSVEKLSSCLDFTCTCGYVTFIDLTSRKHAKRTADEQKTPSCWTPYNVCYGVPLFDSSLNQVITDKMVTGGLLSPESVRKMINTSRTLTLQLIQFISSWNGKDEDISQTSVSYPTKCLMFKSGDLSEWKL